ncbi:LysR family transcriptional regulator [Psychrosphaera sp. F3M07]|uniref:LysR family transcriptional regulator n=1 Tax=Psychrosphaera sp. F3M07 TaxID=2841560 RepID=UPI001C08EAE7|nr:LysR family transcriptional regulator [Psychrosphaera sp. F3M07]MBU2919038.1 LysR family transcriptional regulator [Psychrosphaera sp. F3M07]
MLLEDLQIIVKVAEFRSITAAAVSLDMRVATASAAIKRVEAALGMQLFIRTTRQLRLSSAGERYIPECQQALLTLEQAKQNMQDEQGSVEGELRIALSSDLGRNVVAPWLDEFVHEHPKVKLKLNISDSNIDFYRDAVDVALRYGSPSESNLYGFKICNVPGVLCATSEYLTQHGTPVHPQELVSHNGLFYQLHDVINDVWTFTSNGQEHKIKMSGNRASNDGDLVRRWCVAGHGLAVKSCLDVADDLLEKRIISVMPNYQPRTSELWLVCPSRQSITPAIRLLRDMLKQKCAVILQHLVAHEFIDSHSVR